MKSTENILSIFYFIFMNLKNPQEPRHSKLFTFCRSNYDKKHLLKQLDSFVLTFLVIAGAAFIFRLWLRLKKGRLRNAGTKFRKISSIASFSLGAVKVKLGIYVNMRGGNRRATKGGKNLIFISYIRRMWETCWSWSITAVWSGKCLYLCYTVYDNMRRMWETCWSWSIMAVRSGKCLYLFYI